MKTLDGWLVAFGRTDNYQRGYRVLPAACAVNPAGAVAAAIALLRPWTLKRYARRHGVYILKAYIAEPGSPLHDNDMPMIIRILKIRIERNQ